VSFHVLEAGDAFWRPSNQMKVENTDLAKQLETDALGARFWRLHPGQASTWHRHFSQQELYVVIEGTGRMRVDEERLTLEPHSAVLVEPEHMRQLFNDTDEDVLWLVVGAPTEPITSTLEMSEDQLAHMYPDGPRALPPELGGGKFDSGDQSS
jgi:mannose-6-phosphate isomerase-like protein (cupin superfamily)